MSVTIDDTTIARWAGTPADGVNLTSASFTCPSNCLLVVCLGSDTSAGTSDQTWSISNTGPTLSWTKQGERSKTSDGAGANDGCAIVWTAPVTTGGTATISVQRGSQSHGGSGRMSVKGYIATAGFDTTTNFGATGENSSTTNNYTTSSITPQTSGVLVYSACEWNQDGLPTSSDLTKDAADYTNQIDVMSGYKAVTAGVGATANLDAGGTAAAAWNWCAVEVRAAAAPPGNSAPSWLLKA